VSKSFSLPTVVCGYQLLRHLRQSLNWHYRIRLKSNSWVWRTGIGWQQLNQFHLGQGKL